MRVVEVVPGLLVREDGMVKNTNNHPRWGSVWRAGHPNGGGYLQVGVPRERKLQFVHRFVCIAFHGEPTEGQWVDHINGNISDNRAENLRWASPRENCQNTRKVRGGTKLLGACKRGDRFVSFINDGNKQLYLGSFASAEEANGAYMVALGELQEHGRVLTTSVVRPLGSRSERELPRRISKRADGRFVATGNINGVGKYVGVFSTIEEALEAQRLAENG